MLFHSSGGKHQIQRGSVVPSNIRMQCEVQIGFLREDQLMKLKSQGQSPRFFLDGLFIFDSTIFNIKLECYQTSAKNVSLPN